MIKIAAARQPVHFRVSADYSAFEHCTQNIDSNVGSVVFWLIFEVKWSSDSAMPKYAANSHCGWTDSTGRRVLIFNPAIFGSTRGVSSWINSILKAFVPRFLCKNLGNKVREKIKCCERWWDYFDGCSSTLSSTRTPVFLFNWRSRITNWSKISVLMHFCIRSSSL